MQFDENWNQMDKETRAKTESEHQIKYANQTADCIDYINELDQSVQ